MPIYPRQIERRSANPQYAGKVDEPNAVGISSNFHCGSFVKFSLLIDKKSKTILQAKFLSNGCGFMIAAADTLAEKLIGSRLTDLGGSDEDYFFQYVQNETGQYPTERQDCSKVAINALGEALAHHRSLVIEEFAGEKALICTCFGVSEDSIETAIRQGGANTVELVAEVCRAGSGCGSCRLLIQEMLDLAGGG